MEKLASYLKTTNKTQSEFAEMIGVDQSVVNKYLSRTAKPSITRAVLIARVTKNAVPVDSWVSQ